MRRYDEPIEVKSGQIGAGIRDLDPQVIQSFPEGPTQFIWRDRLWRVLGVYSRWIESGAWWTGPAVRAARGEEHADADSGSDLLCEQEVWRIEAANGREGSRGVYELVHAWSDSSWTLRAVVD